MAVEAATCRRRIRVFVNFMSENLFPGQQRGARAAIGQSRLARACHAASIMK